LGATSIIAKALGAYARSLPHDYGVKLARKVRSQLASFQNETTPFQSKRGPIVVAGVKRTLGMSNDLAQFEPETLRWIDSVLKPGEIVWDIGANVGLYTSYFGKVEGATVYAFEPSAVTFGLLSRNLDANNVISSGKVKAINAALSDSTGFIELSVVSWEPGFTSTTNEDEREERFGEAVGKQSCIAFSGQDFASLTGHKPDHVKIDVDGAEMAVLSGLRPLLPNLSSLLIEVEGSLEKRFDTEILPMLTEANLQKVPIGQPSSGRNQVFAKPELIAMLGTI
jgi:FkbM family methyltransferase